MAGEINFGILDTNAPGKIATSFIQGQQLGLQQRAQELQNQATEAQYQNMLAKQEAYKEAGGDMNKLVQSLTNRGLAEDAMKLRKDIREEAKAGVELKLNEAKLHREDLSALYGDPSDANFAAYLDKNKGRFTPQQVQQAVTQWQAAGTPEARQKMLLPQVLTMDKYVEHLDRQEQQKISRGHLGVAQANLGLAQQREARLAAGQTAATLTPQQNEALFGENGAATRGLINPNKLNARTAKMWADAFILNPNANPTAVSQDIKAAEKSINSFAAGEDGKSVQRLNTASDHLETLQKMIPILKNNDVRAFNAMANELAAQTGQPAPTSFQQAARIVGSEVAKAIIPGQGASKEREEFVKPFSTAASPEQLQGAINVSLNLLGGQYKSLENKYRNATKRTDFADTQLTPGAKNAYQSATGGAKPAAPAAARPAGVGADWQLMTDASGNKAWVSPDKKSFKEVK